MLKTYKAEIKNNSIKWLGDKPEEKNNNPKYTVYITLLDSENENSNDNKKSSITDFFKNSPLADIEDLKLERSDDFGRDIKL